jgi:hypothetical protein
MPQEEPPLPAYTESCNPHKVIRGEQPCASDVLSCSPYGVNSVFGWYEFRCINSMEDFDPFDTSVNFCTLDQIGWASCNSRPCVPAAAILECAAYTTAGTCCSQYCKPDAADPCGRPDHKCVSYGRVQYLDPLVGREGEVGVCVSVSYGDDPF